MTTLYSDGTISVANGSTTVTGVGTAWATALVSGGLLIAPTGAIGIVSAVVSDTSLTLKRPWGGASLSGSAYDIELRSADAATAVWANQRLAEIIARVNAGTFLDFDATGTLAERAAYDGAAKGFVYCQDDVEPFLVSIKQSATSGDWSTRQPLQGPAGILVNWRSAWVTATAYAQDDGVSRNGSSYRCTASHTSGATTEPGTGASWATVWEVIAAKGADGTNGTNGATGPTGPAIGVNFTYSTTTADADPGAGAFRLNNTTIASATAAYIDNSEAGGSAVTSWLDTFDDSTNAVRGTLTIRGVTNTAAFAVFDVTGSVVDGTGYRKLTLAHKSSGGTWTNTNTFSMNFARAGDAGAGAVSSVNGQSGTVVLASKDIEPGAVQTVASAATLNLAGTPAFRYLVTGTTTITAITVGNNKQAVLRFGGALTLTHNATSLILPTGANIVTAAGDIAEIETDGSGNVRVFDYQRASGQPLALPAAAPAREFLTAARTYYVSTTGNNSNNGLSAGAPFLTIQKAMDVVYGTLDLGGQTVTIQLADGTYTAATVQSSPQTGAGLVIINGNSATPANVIVSVTSANAFRALAGSVFKIQNCEIRTTTAGRAASAEGAASKIYFGAGIRFGSCADGHVLAIFNGEIEFENNYNIVGGGNSHFFVDSGGIIICVGRTATLTGTPAFSNFAVAEGLGVIRAFSSVFSGAATGTRYIAIFNGYIHTNGGGASYFPGSVAGSVNNGGLYR